MERYWIENGILAPNECGGLVKYVDAQATVEALQAQIGSYKLVNDMHLKTVDKLSRQVEALQRERDEAQALVSERASMIGSLTAALRRAKAEGVLDAIRVVKKQMGGGTLERKLTDALHARAAQIEEGE